ncbi:MAG: hypothetical protein WC054_01335 [Candidatus Nanopelagicales bacterium]
MIKPARPRATRLDVIDVWFRVMMSFGGLAFALFMVAVMATSPIRESEWVIFALLTSVPFAVAFGFALASWRASVADRRAVRAQRMVIDFAAPSARVRPVRDDRTAT